MAAEVRARGGPGARAGGPGPGRLQAPVARTQPSRSAGPRLRGLPSPDPGSHRCRCPPCPSRSRRGLSASLPWWSPGSHAGRRPDSPLARLPVGPPLPPPPPPLDPHKGDRACALRSAPGPAPRSSHAVRRRPVPRPAPPPTQRGRRAPVQGWAPDSGQRSCTLRGPLEALGVSSLRGRSLVCYVPVVNWRCKHLGPL